MRWIGLLLVVVLVVACRPAVEDDAVRLRGRAVAGPTCPVVTEPPDPACDDRPVEGAEIAVVDSAGDEVARLRTDADGTFAVALSPGDYRLIPQPVDGLLGTAAPIEVRLEAGLDPDPITIGYDTGIR